MDIGFMVMHICGMLVVLMGVLTQNYTLMNSGLLMSILTTLLQIKINLTRRK